MKHAALLAVTAAALCGCKPSPTATTAVDNAVASEDDFLVWAVAGDSKGTTVWLDRDGREQGRVDGILIAHSGALYRLEQSERTVEVLGCETYGDDPDAPPKPGPPGSAQATTLELVSLDDATRVAISTAELDPALVGELDHRASLRGSVGRLLFVEEIDDSYACGAHGNQSVDAFVFDLDARQLAQPVAVDADVAHLAAKARALLDAEAADAGSDTWEGTPALGATLPAWRGGQLAVSHLMWIDACYACGNGLWSSYTSAVWVEDDAVPATLASEAAAVPPAIAAVLTAQPAPSGVSWGTADEQWRTTFAAR